MDISKNYNSIKSLIDDWKRNQTSLVPKNQPSVFLFYPIDGSPLDTLTTSQSIISNFLNITDKELFLDVVANNIPLIIQDYRIGKIVMNVEITAGVIRGLLDRKAERKFNNFDLMIMGGVWKGNNEEAQKDH